MKSRARQRIAAAAAAIAAIGLIVYLIRVPLLTGAGRLLVAAGAPVHADVLVVMRGDETSFERTLTSAALFHAGYAGRIYVSSALNDLASSDLRNRGIKLPSPQDNIAAILQQKNVPCDRIMLDGNAPGGGTFGEATRLAAVMTAQRLSTALIVTSWFHARRARWTMDSVLGNSGKTATIVLAQGPIGPENWWTYRYTSLTVMEELLKLAAYGVLREARFGDDPANSPRGDLIQAPSGCTGNS